MKLPRRVFAAFLILAASNAAAFYVALEDRTQNINRINDGRRTALNAICASVGAVAEAGRTVITGSARTPRTEREKRFERNLQRLGYPSIQERRERARAAGRAYVENIARAVEQETGIGDLVVKSGPKAGQLDCARLQTAAKVKPARRSR